jgi:hypothetical protein
MVRHDLLPAKVPQRSASLGRTAGLASGGQALQVDKYGRLAVKRAAQRWRSIVSEGVDTRSTGFCPTHEIKFAAA